MSRWLIENDSFVAGLFGLDTRQEMMLVVIRLQFSVDRIQTGGIEGAGRRFSNKA